MITEQSGCKVWKSGPYHMFQLRDKEQSLELNLQTWCIQQDPDTYCTGTLDLLEPQKDSD